MSFKKNIALDSQGNPKEYNVPKCFKHKSYYKIVISTGKKYPRTYGFYCEKCNDDFLKAMKKELNLRGVPNDL